MTKIGSYTLRKVNERDRDLLAVWIEEDPDHRDRVDADFFLHNAEGKECFAVENARGMVVFYIKMTRALRLDIQFGPDETRDQREQNMDAMLEGFRWLEVGAAGAGIWEILFNSTNEPLTRFAERKLAFRKDPNELLHKVTARPSYRPNENT